MKHIILRATITVFLAYVVGSAILDEVRSNERQAVQEACGTDLECELVEDVINRMEGK